jgi:hypothetical protein
MALSKKGQDAKRVIPLDRDKLGMIGAIAVLIMSVFSHRGDIVTTLQEMLEQERVAKDQEKGEEPEDAEEKPDEET